MNFSIKIQSENMKMTWNISLFPFGMIAIFQNVMALQLLEIISVKQCGIKFVPLLCNHGNLTLKLSENIATLMKGGFFLGRFKVGSLPRMTNKEVLAQFIHKPKVPNQLKNCLP